MRIKLVLACVLATSLGVTGVTTSGSAAVTRKPAAKKPACTRKPAVRKPARRSVVKKPARKPACKPKTQHPGARLYNTTIKVTGIEHFTPTTDKVKGQVSSPNRACLAAPIALYKEAGALDQKINTDRVISSSPSDGTFEYLLYHGDGPAASGQFYAAITGPYSKPRGIKCNPSTSRLFTAGDPSVAPTTPTTPTDPSGPSKPQRPERPPR